MLPLSKRPYLHKYTHIFEKKKWKTVFVQLGLSEKCFTQRALNESYGMKIERIHEDYIEDSVYLIAAIFRMGHIFT